MKHILLKSVKTEGGETFSYKDQLITIVRNGGANGIAVGEMEDRLRILRVLREYEDGQIMDVEDNDFKNMCKYVKESKWLSASEEAFNFINDVQNGDDSLEELGVVSVASSARNGSGKVTVEAD